MSENSSISNNVQLDEHLRKMQMQNTRNFVNRPDQPNVFPLFSDPLYMKALQYEDVNIEAENFEFVGNSRNSITTDVNVLSRPAFKSLKEQVALSLYDYFYEMMKVKRQTELYITQSWINKTEKGQFHHRHRHPNSVLSGVLYLNECHPSGVTRFASNKFQSLAFDFEEFNNWNTVEFIVPPQKGMLLIFPSSMPHETAVYEGEEPRYSLSFNTFVRGTLHDMKTQSLTL